MAVWGVCKNIPLSRNLLEDTAYSWTQVKIATSEVERLHSQLNHRRSTCRVWENPCVLLLRFLASPEGSHKASSFPPAMKIQQHVGDSSLRGSPLETSVRGMS